MARISRKKDVGVIVHKHGVGFRVWAPFAHTVAVTGSFNDWSRTLLESEGDGHWYALVENAEVGQEYKFIINSGQSDLYHNDPRALQLTTTSGNSVIADPLFDWENQEQFVKVPLNQQVIYELHVGTFARIDASTIGTFKDVITKLDYLNDLGITTIELMPICSMSMDRGWGYAPDYMYAVESLYGGRKEFLEFVKAAHAREIAVILDVVYNHLGPDEHLDLWQFDGWNVDGKGGIYFYNDWRSKTPWGETRPDYGRTEVRQYITDNVLMWVKDCHLDGLRLDSTIYMRNIDGKNDDQPTDLADGWRILQEVTELAYKVNPGTLVIAEDVGANDYITKLSQEGGAGFSSQWSVQFPSVMRKVLESPKDEERDLTALCEVLKKKHNNDVFQRIIYSDSHDSAANGGARLTEEIAPGDANNVYARRRSLLAAAIVLTTPGIPMLFQGQEFLEDGSFSDWQVLDWEKAERFSGIVSAVKHLIALRKNDYDNSRGLTGQNFSVLHLNEESKVLAYHRWEQGGVGDDVVVVFNFTNHLLKNYSINLPAGGTWHVRFNSDWHGYSQDFKSGDSEPVIAQESTASLSLPPYTVLILSQDK